MSLPWADKTEGHRVELLAMWGIFARENIYRGCCTLSPSCTTPASASEAVLGKMTRVHALTSRACAGSISGAADFGVHPQPSTSPAQIRWSRSCLNPFGWSISIVNVIKTFGFQQYCLWTAALDNFLYWTRRGLNHKWLSDWRDESSTTMH